MRCPFCSHSETRVVDKRESGEDITRRRRECEKCKKRFTTYERVETDLIVIKKDGRRIAFDREKVKAGVLKACEKRPVALADVEQLVDAVERELRSKESHEVRSSVIGDLVMRKLQRLDKVAYIRFASVYREFADIGAFQKELRKLVKR